METVSHITKDRMKQVIDDVYETKKFQMFIMIMTHAQTCDECVGLFFKSMEKAKNHLNDELK